MRPKKHIVLITDDFALRFAIRNDSTFRVLGPDPLDLDYQAIEEFRPIVIAIDKRREFPIDLSRLPTHDYQGGDTVRLLFIGDGPGRYAELTASVIENLKIMAAVRKGPKCVRLDQVCCRVIKPVG